MAKASFLTLSGDTLSDAQRRTLAKVACAVAWADGNLVEAEQAELAKCLEELGGIQRSELDAMVLGVKLLDDVIKEELRALPAAEGQQVLKFAFRIANADGRVSEQELAVLREASAVLFPDKPWDLTLDWIRSHQTMVGLVDLAPGALFAEQFRVVRRLSEGGMGAVYAVEQIATGALRALKLMHPQLVSDPKLRKRFEQEARVGARIESEHVVQVVAAGVDASSGAPWLAMELLRGEDLGQYAERVGCLPPSEVRDLFEQLCHAVGAAHSCGIVHRDLKPENIFLAAAKRVGTPYVIKVLDFGIAKVASEAKTADTAAIGTPIWMAPEQSARGQSISPAADVWALGLIAFRLLTGRVFWRSANDEGANATMLLREIVLDPIPPASGRASELGCADRLVAGFDSWFAKCVVRDVSQRFQSASDAFSALEPILRAVAATSSSRNRLAEAVARASAAGPRTSGTAFDSTRPALAAASTDSQLAASHTNRAADASRPRRRLRILAGAAGVVTSVVALAWFVRAREHAAAAQLPAPSAAALSAAILPATSAPRSAPPLAASFEGGPPMRMLRVPGGAFSMGSRDGEDDERPVHTETVDPFDIDETEVTVAQYAACVRGHACAEPIALTGCNENVPGRADHPMNCVTWTEADTFCRAAGKRLPSEREWEYAAKGMSPRRWPWGPVPPRAQMCWDGDGNSVGKGNRQSTCPVGAYAEDKGPFGVLDLGGNVAEWTASRYCPYTDPNCTSDARVIRGCGWDTQAVAACTTTYRDKRSEFEKETSLGFRCARTP